jgi:two-component system, NarL family, nitrate/nitrite response regulator NarL
MGKWCSTNEAVQRAAPLPGVTIVSDVMLYREGLAVSLLRDGRLRILDIIASHDALPAISANIPDAILLDGGMDDCLALARVLRANLPQARIVGFGISGGADRLVDCAESGLAAFVDSSSSVAELISAVLGAMNGELSCSPQVSALMCERLARLSAGRSKQSAALTLRERQVARLIGRGLSNKEIARDLRIGASTVKNHVHTILEKLNVKRRSAIVHQLGQFPWMDNTMASQR